MADELKLISDVLTRSKINLLKFQVENTLNAEHDPVTNIVMYIGSFPHTEGVEMLRVLLENCTNISINSALFDGIRRPAILLYDVTDKEKTTNVCRVEEDAGLFSFWCEEVTYKRVRDGVSDAAKESKEDME